MSLKGPRSGHSVPWISMTDLSIGLFALFVLAFLALWALKDRVTEDYTRKESEYRACVDEKRAAQEALQLYDQQLGEKLQVPIRQGLLAVSEGRIDIQAALLFPSGQWSLTTSGQKIVSTVADAFKVMVQQDTSFMLMVAGYTDDVPIKGGPFRTNWELSSARATDVVHALIANGFPADRVFAAGFGEYHPRNSNEDAGGRALNRRVEIVRVPMNRQAGWTKP
jgi:flagellar motor protein MotB